MKKQLLLFAFVIAMGSALAQDTITGWTFPANSGTDSLNANLGTTKNKGYDLRYQLTLTPTTDSTINTIYFASGATTYAAATAGWQDGNGMRFWSIKFKADTVYKNFRVYSKQRSNADGPRDFKLQWRLSNTSYADITGGTVVAADDWTTGVVDNLAVPIAGQGTNSIYIRWVQNSNESVSGGVVASAGVSMIDDILVTAVNPLGVHEIVYTNRVSLYPNPNQGSFTVKSNEPLSSLTVADITGKTVYRDLNPATVSKVNLSGAAKGTYFLKVRFAGSEESYTSKFIIF